MRIVTVKRNSKWLDDIVALGDLSRSVMGFLPKQAFYEYAEKGNILAAHEANELMGYILFRWREASIVIVHLCVNPLYRKKGVAKALVEELCARNDEYYDFLRLSCRRDYGLDAFWRTLGFCPISERPGRAINTSTVLTTWIKNTNVSLFCNEQIEPALSIKAQT